MIGIGQSLRGDDTTGLEAVRIWRAKYAKHAPEVQIELAEVPGIGLLNLLIGFHHAILVDAVLSGKPPGHIHRIQEENIVAFTSGTQSAHGWGIAETLKMGKYLYPDELPETITIFGIEIQSVDMGAKINPAVQESLPKLVDEIEKEIELLCKSEV